MPLRRLNIAAVLLVAMLHVHLAAQAGLWAHYQENKMAVEPKPIELPNARRASLVHLIKTRASTDAGGCEGQDLVDLLEGLNFESIAMAPNRELILVEAGSGCARGGQGANGSMWLFRFDGEKPVLLASPAAGFEGWLFSVQTVQHTGMPDVILGWHMSAAETVLTYFQFDGIRYHSTGKATLESDEQGREVLNPE